MTAAPPLSLRPGDTCLRPQEGFHSHSSARFLLPFLLFFFLFPPPRRPANSPFVRSFFPTAANLSNCALQPPTTTTTTATATHLLLPSFSAETGLPTDWLTTLALYSLSRARPGYPGDMIPASYIKGIPSAGIPEPSSRPLPYLKTDPHLNTAASALSLFSGGRASSPSQPRSFMRSLDREGGRPKRATGRPAVTVASAAAARGSRSRTPFQ